MILVRQKGSIFHPSVGVKMGRDFSLYAVKPGVLKFIHRQGKQFLTIE